MDAHLPCKRRRVDSGDGSSVPISGASAAVVQLPSLMGGSLVVDGATQANAIPIGDSSDDDNGDASIPKVNNKEIVSFLLLLVVVIVI